MTQPVSLMDGVDFIDDFSCISNNDAGIINLETTGNGTRYPDNHS